MPFTPESIGRAMDQSNQPLKRGEEGILHRIEVNDRPYYAKEWRGRHFEGADQAPRSFMFEDESTKTPVSPFWFKTKYYEGLLLQEAFPENTLRIEAGYDPRLKKEGDGVRFVPDVGRPVTLTKAIESGSEAQKKRDQIVDTMYEAYFDQFASDEKGLLKGKNSMAARMVMTRADAAILDEFGSELISRGFDWHHPRTSLHALAGHVGRINPQSILIEFFESGLLPIHPTLNVIPTKDDDPGGRHRVFIEVAIADIRMLREKLHEKAGSDSRRQLVDQKLARYKLYRGLDDVYNELFTTQYTASEPTLKEDPDVANAVYQILESVRKDIDAGQRDTSSILFSDLRQDLGRILRMHVDKQELLAALQAFTPRKD